MYILFMYLSGLFIASLGQENTYYRSDEMHLHFQDFKETYGKNYTSHAESYKRFQIFKENLEEINSLNLDSEAIYGITEFTDWTEEEYVSVFNSGVLDNTNTQLSSCKVITDADIQTNDAPASLDYRDKNMVTPVKNQGKCQSCWAFATIGSIEGQYALRYNVHESLSEQQLMDCLRCSGHCSRGSYMVLALSELIQTPGVMSQEDYPYVERDLPCHLDRTRARVRITGCLNFNLRDEDKLKEALFKYGPIAIAVNARTFRYYRGGIFTVRDCPVGEVGHAVLLVGYGTEGGKNYWLIKNSSGKNFGLQGYIKISRGENSCNLMNNNAASALIA